MCVDGIEGHSKPCQSSLCSWQVGTQPVVIYSPPKSTANIWYLLAICTLVSVIEILRNASRRSRMTDNNSIDSAGLIIPRQWPQKDLTKKSMCVIFNNFFLCQGGQLQAIKETDKSNMRVANYWGDYGMICTVRHPIHLILEFFSKAKMYG